MHTSITTALAVLGLVTAAEARFDRRTHRNVAKRATADIHTGTAFWGAQKGRKGACGEVHEDGYDLIGISNALWSPDQCGKFVQILNGANNQSIVLPIKDSCEKCGESDVYLSPGAFEKLADLETGVIQVAWTFVAAPPRVFHAKHTPKAKAEETDCTTTSDAPEKTPEAKAASKVAAPRVEAAAPQQPPKSTPIAKTEEPEAEEPKAREPEVKKPEVERPKVEKPAAEKPQDRAPAQVPATPKGGNGFKLGLPWAVDNRWSTVFAGSRVKFYHHWRDLIVPEMPSGIEFWPTFYDRSSVGAFETQLASSPNPAVILGHNEPELEAQGFSTVENAVQDYKTHLVQHAGSGTELCAPSIAWDLNGWLIPFMEQCKDCKITCLSLHSYDDYDPSAARYKERVENAHKAFPDLNIYMTEVGLTADSGPSEQQAMAYMKELVSWSQSTGYVKGLAWFGAWSENPDGFAATSGRFFEGPHSLTALGQAYAFGS